MPLAYNKVIAIEDFSDPELKPHLDAIEQDEMIRFGLSQPANIPDSKQWECAMMLRTFADHGAIRPNALFAGIGAGTEQTTFTLASQGCIAFPIDRYLEVTPWSDVAPASMMVRPSQFTELSYERGHVIPVHGDARAANLPSEFFDGVYSAGSIEHFGSLAAVEAAAEEIGRLLKPGGVAAISTEFRLEGPNDRPWFDDNCILFTPDLVRRHIVDPSGLELIDDLRAEPSARTFDSRVVLLDFLAKAGKVKTVEDKKNAYPNLVLNHEGFLFCSVHLALRKPSRTTVSLSRARSDGFLDTVKEEAVAASGVLQNQIAEWRQRFTQDQNDMLTVTERERVLEAELASLRATAAADAAEKRKLHIIVAATYRALGGTAVDALLRKQAAPVPTLPWREVARWSADVILTTIGVLRDGRLSTDERQGFLSYGPYISLPPGTYRVSFGVVVERMARGRVELDAMSSQGLVARVGVDKLPKPNSYSDRHFLELNFVLSEQRDGVEFRLKKQGGVSIGLLGIQLDAQDVALPA